MKKLLLTVISAILVLNGYSQQQFTVKLNRTNKGGGSKISLYYLGEQKTTLRKKSDFTFKETIPSDSIIELAFKVAGARPTKFFLYSNNTFNYDLNVKQGIMGVIQIKDNSIYPVSAADSAAAAKKGILPKGVSVNKSNLGISYLNEKTLNSDRIREQWARKGGKITGKSLAINMSFASMTSKTTPKSKTIIAGSGYVLGQNFYNLKIPEYKTGIATWTSLIYGYSASVNLHMFQTTVEKTLTTKEMVFSSGAFVFMFTGNIGYTLGLGKFKTQTDYKGFAVDLTYRPSIIASMAEGGGSTQLNMKGFGVDITRNSFSAFANSLAPRAKSRFSFLLLPPIKDTPLMITLGYGLVWYR